MGASLACWGMHKQGRPIYIQLIGKVNVQELQKITTDERMIKYHIQVSNSSYTENGQR